MKEFFIKLNEWEKEYNGFFVLLPIIITVTVGLLKFWYVLFIVGINYYNGLPLFSKIPFMPDTLSQIFFFIGLTTICILTNYYCYYMTRNRKSGNLFRTLLFIFVIILFISFAETLSSLDIPSNKFMMYFAKRYLTKIVLIYIFILFIFAFFGVFLGFSYKENTVLSNVNEKLSEKTFGLIKKLPKSICNLIITILGILLFFSPFWLGKAFAEDNKSYYVIENENLVIMADGDENYLCHSFIEKNNIIYFDTSKIIPCAKDKAIIAKKFDKNIRGGAKIAETSKNIQVPTHETSSEALQ